ncbi:hypothetical protein VNO77_22861 [Canavalia gladiata]|uniref:Uncharacterized protein n=1 Tax=Canavalia gladiata TaxID=3824 RepID=A0AAN9QB64_CANGL
MHAIVGCMLGEDLNCKAHPSLQSSPVIVDYEMHSHWSHIVLAIYSGPVPVHGACFCMKERSASTHSIEPIRTPHVFATLPTLLYM